MTQSKFSLIFMLALIFLTVLVSEHTLAMGSKPSPEFESNAKRIRREMDKIAEEKSEEFRLLAPKIFGEYKCKGEQHQDVRIKVTDLRYSRLLGDEMVILAPGFIADKLDTSDRTSQLLGLSDAHPDLGPSLKEMYIPEDKEAEPILVDWHFIERNAEGIPVHYRVEQRSVDGPGTYWAEAICFAAKEKEKLGCRDVSIQKFECEIEKIN